MIRKIILQGLNPSRYIWIMNTENDTYFVIFILNIYAVLVQY